jgi:hypothetical protein
MAIEFDVVLPDRPGELGRLASTLAEKGVNIDAIAAHTAFGKGYVAVLPAEPGRARDALKGAGLTFTEKTVLTVQLEDRPGTLAELAKKLGAAGVNITSLVPIGARGGTVQLAIGVDDVEKARRVV